MYAGHAAVALFARGKRPGLPLALLVPVAFGPDWVQWIFAATGRENRQLSHSLVSVFAASTVIALIYWLVARSPGRGRNAAALWLVYVLHWPADFITGIKPTWPGGPDVGLLLYANPVADVLLETALVCGAWIAYRQSLPVVARPRSIAPLVPLGLVAMQVGSAVLGVLSG